MLDNPARFAALNVSGNRVDESFAPDVLLRDGDMIHLGNTDIRCVLTPGHTIGCMSHFWTAYDGAERKRIGIYGGAGFISLSEEFIQKNGLPADIREAFAASIDKVFDEPVDIMLGNHPFHNDTYEKWERMQAGAEANLFIDPTEWQRYLTHLRDCYNEFLQMSGDEVHAMYAESQFLRYRDIVTPYLLDGKQADANLASRT